MNINFLNTLKLILIFNLLKNLFFTFQFSKVIFLINLLSKKYIFLLESEKNK